MKDRVGGARVERRVRRAGWWLLVLALALVPAAGAQPAPGPGAAAVTPETDRIAEAAMTRLRSPYTASHTVDMCPSAGALRDSIRFAAASGLTTDQIVEDVIARHGEQLRLLPKRSGAGLWAWLLPPLVLLTGAWLIANRLRRDRPDPRLPVVRSDLSRGEREELDEALRDWERRGGVEV